MLSSSACRRRCGFGRPCSSLGPHAGFVARRRACRGGRSLWRRRARFLPSRPRLRSPNAPKVRRRPARRLPRPGCHSGRGNRSSAPSAANGVPPASLRAHRRLRVGRGRARQDCFRARSSTRPNRETRRRICRSPNRACRSRHPNRCRKILPAVPSPRSSPRSTVCPPGRSLYRRRAGSTILLLSWTYYLRNFETYRFTATSSKS